MTGKCIKDSTIGEMADIGTFVITEGNVAQTGLYSEWCLLVLYGFIPIDNI